MVDENKERPRQGAPETSRQANGQSQDSRSAAAPAITRDEAIRRFEADLTEPDRAEIRRELADRTLMCLCPPYEVCHADVPLRFANGGAA